MAEPLVTVAELERRLGHALTGTLAEQAQAILEDASAEVRDIGKPDLDAVEFPATPPLIVTVVVSMARRALSNPLGLSGEAIDGHQWQASGQTGVFATEAEQERILRALGRLSAVSIGLENYLPVYDRHLSENDVLASIQEE